VEKDYTTKEIELKGVKALAREGTSDAFIVKTGYTRKPNYD